MTFGKPGEFSPGFFRVPTLSKILALQSSHEISVKNLLAITLLAALTVNGCNTFSQLTTLQIENSKLQSRLTNYRSHTVNFEERKLLYERAIEATAVRMRDLNSDGKEHEELINGSNQQQAGRSGEKP